MAEETRRRRPHTTIDDGGDYSDGEANNISKRRPRRRRKRRSRDLDPPFHFLVMQVGAGLFVLCCVTYYLWQSLFPESAFDDGTYYEEREALDDDATINAQLDMEAIEAAAIVPTPAPTIPTAPPLPVWDLGEATKYDAFGIAAMYNQQLTTTESNSHTEFWTTAENLRNDFAELYGGENSARAIMERGLTLFPQEGLESAPNKPPSDLISTACRIRRAKEEGRPFKVTFGGYSVTVGRGNYFGQSFPFVMKRILEAPFRQLGVELSVQNAAIGGCPSFPYGFCKKNHWGEDSDVVSWDFSMNEPGGVAEGLEAYLRHTMTLSHRPKLIVKDTYMAEKRRELLKKYVEHGAIQDPVVLHSDPAVKPFLERKEAFRPIGFQDWRKFGSPPGAPGQALHHPAVKEHEMLGWTLAMHFLSALELIAAGGEGSTDTALQFTCPSQIEERENQLATSLLPPPFTVNATTMEEWSSIFFGVPQNTAKGDSTPDLNRLWKMNPVHCKTSYEPIVDEDGSLTSIVVSGSVGEDMNLMLPKGHMFYNQAWVLDLSEGEKEAKRKLDRFEGLGFVDSKEAYRGLFTSGTLKLLLPFYDEEQKHPDERNAKMPKPKVGDSARDWYQSIVICEVNERREPSACDVGKDITFLAGGVNATKVTKLNTPGTLYLGKKICTYIDIPSDAKLSSRQAMKLQDPLLSDAEQKETKEALESGNVLVGLPLELKVHNHLIVARNTACSVSHVVWEQRTPEGTRLPLKRKESGRRKAASNPKPAAPTGREEI